MKVALISANLGGYDAPNVWPDLIAPEGVSIDVHRFTDENLPPRPQAMTSRLQCGIPKWFGPDFAPDAEIIIWIDGSCAPTPIVVTWFLERLKGAEIAVFAHPERKTIRDEYEFIKARMARRGETYLTSRYRGEDFDGQYAHISAENMTGLPLYASTAFAYRPTRRIRRAFEEVWLMKSRYLLHDQLAFPFALHRHVCMVRTIPDNYLSCPALTFTRKRRAA